MKHSRISLLERAAEVYDLGAAMRSRGPAPEPVATPEPVAAPEIERVVPVARPERVFAEPRTPEPRTPEPRMPVPRAPLKRRPGALAEVNRVALAEAGFIVPDAPVTGLAEEFRIIKRQLLASIERRVALPEAKRRSVLISSAQSGEGKSFCAVNMALSLAGESDVEVLLVDADCAKPDVLPILGMDPAPGLMDALADPNADPEDFVIGTDVKGLSVLPAGARTNNVPELLASERTREVLERLVAVDQRRIILLDSPPALVASPATVLAGHVGQVLVVVRADRTTEADLRETIALLSGCDHVSLILNGAGITVTGRKFGSYHGYGHDD
jgi:exopolysaccharide/PEP-CTERM locus tyrosine autokinase